MAKFCLLLSVIICFSQNLQVIHADFNTPQEKASITQIIKIIEDLTNNIKSIVEDLSKRLPLLLKNLESNIKNVVGDFNIADIFESAREEIENIVKDSSFVTSECADRSEDELTEINEVTKSAINNCVAKAQDRTKDIQGEVTELMGKAGQLAQEMTKKISKCGNENGEDAIGLSQCLEEEINQIKNMLNMLKETATESMDVTENIAAQVAIDAAECLKDVKTETMTNTERVVLRLKSCNHDEL